MIIHYVVDDNKFRQSCLQSKQRVFFFLSLSLPKDKPSRGKSQGELCGRWRRTHSLAFISCNTHLHIFSSAPGIHQLSRSPDKMQQKLHFENKSSYSAWGWFLSKSSVCISRLHDESKGGGGGWGVRGGRLGGGGGKGVGGVMQESA